MVVYLVAVGKSRFELYSEPREEAPAEPDEQAGRFQRWAHSASVKWHELVEQSRLGAANSRLGRFRDGVVCRLAENIAEQRTLWGLRGCSHATLVYPSTLGEAEARRTLQTLAAHARRYHFRWLVVDLLLAIASGVLALVPGPNLLAYYFLFRLIGHLQSWRGARQAAERIEWTLTADECLSELASLVNVPRAARAMRVEAIAERLNLPRLSAYFDRVAVPSA
jgi:hypothetical protein